MERAFIDQGSLFFVGAISDVGLNRGVGEKPGIPSEPIREFLIREAQLTRMVFGIK